MTHHFKTQLGMPAAHIRVLTQVPPFLLLNKFPTYASWEVVDGSPSVWAMKHSGVIQMDFLATELGLTQSHGCSVNYCSTPADGRQGFLSLSLSFSISLPFPHTKMDVIWKEKCSGTGGRQHSLMNSSSGIHHDTYCQLPD